jgi:hypothetical protein
VELVEAELLGCVLSRFGSTPEVVEDQRQSRRERRSGDIDPIEGCLVSDRR